MRENQTHTITFISCVVIIIMSSEEDPVTKMVKKVEEKNRHAPRFTFLVDSDVTEPAKAAF